MTDDDCPHDGSHKTRIEWAAREIVRRLSGNALAALIAVSAMAASRGPRSKGGKVRARAKHREVWDKYGRKDVLKELKAIFRADRSIGKASAVKKLKDQLNPDCADKTLARLFDKWKATEARLFSKGH